VTTSYSGSAVTVTDQAGKKRSNLSDALGRLSQVTEDPGGLNYVTDYTYDVLGNLREVNQGGAATLLHVRLSGAAHPCEEPGAGR
jgi:hypothetical protein